MDNDIRRAADSISMFCRLQMVMKKNLPVRSSEMGVLIYVHQQQEPVTPLMISQFFQIAKPSVTNIINELVQHEYLAKEPSQEDKRSYSISLTEKGTLLVSQTHEAYFRMISLLQSELGKEDFAHFIELLDRSNKILNEERLK